MRALGHFGLIQRSHRRRLANAAAQRRFQVHFLHWRGLGSHFLCRRLGQLLGEGCRIHASH